MKLMRMDPFNFLQNRMNQLWSDFDRDFAPMLQRLNPMLEQQQQQQPNIPMITSASQSCALQNSPALSGALQAPQAAWLPSIRLDVRETPQEVIVAADLPGVPKESIKASVDEDGLLQIRAERREERTENEPSGQWTWRERHSGLVQRSIQLPKSIDAGKAAQTEFKDGVLQLKFNKRPERQGHAIEIN